jgi:hypothetical protein
MLSQTRTFVRYCAAALTVWAAIAYAAPAAAPVRAEIEALLSKLETAGCQFNRNGSWYSGAQAKTHLLRKLEYIESHGTVQSTEQFIDLAASRSSSSGKAYQVKCGNEAPLESGIWLKQKLASVRAEKAAR